MTATQLYEHDSGFRGFMDHWIQDRRCPQPLVDYLLDREMHRQAECARWCEARPDLPVYAPMVDHGERPGSCGTFPTSCFKWTGGDRELMWFWDLQQTSALWAHELPKERVELTAISSSVRDAVPYSTPLQGLLGVMDAWIVD